MSLLQRLRY
ncbi:hypothetical protein NXF25_013761 [Crotalus adamanteus]|uniref:Uncharacterized protein n=1 Tax=Crotalus adamanteus TaxID=8729 RepID=A0AAW1BAJ7_CROAD